MAYWKNREVGSIKAISPTTGKIIDVYPQRDARIGGDIDAELIRLPALLSWWYALRDLAEKHLREVQHAEHNVSEDLYAELRDKSPKATETTIKMAVKAHQKMRDAFRERMDAEDMHQQLASQAKAMEEKRWSLMGLTKTALMERGTKDSM
jgi:hypothetical protein